jgi:hypothetical protein
MNKKTHFLKLALCAGLVASMAALSGCEADGDPSEAGGIGGGGDGSLFPNDGTTGGNITEDGTPIAGGNTGFNFVCTGSAKRYGPSPSSEAVANGLVGGVISRTLLSTLLGAGPLEQLLASVKDVELAIDGDLDSYSTFTLPLSLLNLPAFSLINSVDQVVKLNGTVPAGQYAVFGVSFPIATVELSANTVAVKTFRNGVATGEQATVTVTALDLLGQVGIGERRAFVGIKATQPYDSASIGLGAILSANVGDAMYVHEFCTEGRLVAAP